MIADNPLLIDLADPLDIIAIELQKSFRYHLVADGMEALNLWLSIRDDACVSAFFDTE